MEKYVDFKRETVPARYELSCGDKSFSLRVRREIVEEISKLNWGHMWVPHFQKTLGLGEFVGPREGDWGFGSSLLGTESDDIWIGWKCPLPVIKDSHGEQFALRATLEMLFIGISLAKNWPESGEPQLIWIEGMSVRKELNGGALQATLTPVMIRWLAEQPHESHLEPVRGVMIGADEHMWPNQRTFKDGLSRRMHHYSFLALCRQPKWLNLQVPGNACGLDPDNYNDMSLEVGYHLVPHNVDSGLQQLTFLMGLAKLHDLARGK